MMKNEKAKEELELISEMTMRYLTSIEYIIDTKGIFELENEIKRWMRMACPGAIIYGRPRIGKTRALHHLAKKLKEDNGNTYPVIIWDITDHPSTEKNFYTSLLLAIGIQDFSRIESALNLKTRLLNYLILAANENPRREVTILIDEAWKLSIKDFTWLMDIHNILNHNNIKICVLLFGTQELRQLKTSLRNIGQQQILERFMVKEYEYHGIQSIEEMYLCLRAFDEVRMVSNDEIISSLSLSEFYFPDAEKNCFADLTELFWEGFSKQSLMSNMKEPDIPMYYLVQAFIMLLYSFGSLSENSVTFPSKSEVERSIKYVNYSEY